jgi:hypothetical protein
MATRDEYIAGAAAIAVIAEGYISAVPGIWRQHIPMDQVNDAINKAAVAAIDAAEKVRSAVVAQKPQG